MKIPTLDAVAPLVLLSLFFAGCARKPEMDPAAGAPPYTAAVSEQDPNVIQVDHPDQFPLVTAGADRERPKLDVTGVVAPDVTRTIPVVSLASGRVAGVYARLGDDVRKGQLLLKIQSSDLSSAFADYEKAQADETLARVQLTRSRDLFGHGAIAAKDLEVAQDTDEKAKVDLATTAARVRILGGDVGHPSGVVDIYAPVSGTIVEQNVTQSAGVKTLDNSPNLFTIADLSKVWILCDVYEDNLASVETGEPADVRLNAYPDRIFHARIANIGKILDPNLHTAKVRLDLDNPGMMRAGMFATATLYGPRQTTVATLPPSAVLHLHDRNWVFVPAGRSRFRRIAVVSSNPAGGGLQIIESGIAPGQQVVRDPLQLSSTAAQ